MLAEMFAFSDWVSYFTYGQFRTCHDGVPQ
jgi:hypothetical protein